VIDADLQHDETQLPKNVGAACCKAARPTSWVGSPLRRRAAVLTVFDKQRARPASACLATVGLRKKLTAAGRDRRTPMSGFFFHDPPRNRFGATGRRSSRRKVSRILLDNRPQLRAVLFRIKEIPYSFGSRLHGESKLDSMVALDFLGLPCSPPKLTGDVVVVALPFCSRWSARSVCLVHLVGVVCRARSVQRAVSGGAGRAGRAGWR